MILHAFVKGIASTSFPNCSNRVCHCCQVHHKLGDLIMAEKVLREAINIEPTAHVSWSADFRFPFAFNFIKSRKSSSAVWSQHKTKPYFSIRFSIYFFICLFIYLFIYSIQQLHVSPGSIFNITLLYSLNIYLLQEV